MNYFKKTLILLLILGSSLSFNFVEGKSVLKNSRSPFTSHWIIRNFYLPTFIDTIHIYNKLRLSFTDEFIQSKIIMNNIKKMAPDYSKIVNTFIEQQELKKLSLAKVMQITNITISDTLPENKFSQPSHNSQQKHHKK